MIQTIKIISKSGYLNLEDLPHNCIFNKVITGCGGTTIALKNAENYVIAVPYVELIVNKLNITEGGVGNWEFTNDDGSKISHQVFGLFGYFSQCKNEFERYVATEGVKKIMCTYDQLPKLKQYIDTSEYRLLVDEYHQLLKAYSYRAKAIDGVLDEFRSVKSYCFLSATPIQTDFKPEAMKDVPEVMADWGEVEKLKVVVLQTDKPYMKAANFIQKYQKQGCITVDGYKSTEAFFFINSVTDIADIIKHCELKPEEVKIVCADTEKNRQKLEGYQIENSRTPGKKFTFITSKSFEGADYFSKSAITYVVSSGKKSYTLLSIDTDIPQIAGRIRDTKFSNLVVHIMSPNENLYKDVSYDEFKARQQKAMDDTKEIVTTFNNMPESQRKMVGGSFKNNMVYLHYDEDQQTFFFNDRLPKLDLYNYQITQEVYKSGISLAKYYKEKGMEIQLTKFQKLKEDIEAASHTPSFKEVYTAYSDFRKEHNNFGGGVVSEDIEKLLVWQPLVKDAYYKLGDEKVSKLRYTVSKVEDALDAVDETKDQDNKIASILSRKVTPGFISCKEAKSKLKNAYKVVGKSETATATDIRKWYEADDMVKNLGGNSVRGFNIIRPQFMFTEP